MPSATSRRLTCRWLTKAYAAASVPALDWSMFVPKARCGGTPTARKTGSTTSPPPPVIAFTHPAARPVMKRSGRSHGASGAIGIVCAFSRPDVTAPVMLTAVRAQRPGGSARRGRARHNNPPVAR
jgi:hypothetical protein